MSTPIDPAQVMAAHERQAGEEVAWCINCADYWPCLPYLLASELADERAKVQRVEEAVGDVRLTITAVNGIGPDVRRGAQLAINPVAEALGGPR